MDLFCAKLGTGIDCGDAVFLRPLQPQDINENYISWFRDTRVTRFLEAKDISANDALVHLVDGFVRDAWYMYAIIDRSRNLHIGNLKIGPINKKNQTAELSILIGDIESWGKGFATLVYSLSAQLAFNQLGLRKLYGGLMADNYGAIHALKKAGWKQEAELLNDTLHEGEIKSRLLFSVLNSENLVDKVSQCAIA